MEHEYDLSIDIDLDGSDPIEACERFLEIIQDYVEGHVEWLAFGYFDKVTRESGVVYLRPDGNNTVEKGT